MSEKHAPQYSNAEVESQYERYLMPIWKNLHVPIKEAQGCTVEDFDGNEYLDMFSGIAVQNAGHGNEAIVEAAKEQLDTFTHGCTYLHPHEPAARLAEKLAQVTPGDLKKTFFANSGTEAVEGAVKLARKYTGSTEVLALEMSFHGRTQGSLALTGNKGYKSGMSSPKGEVAHASPPYAYRCQMCDGGPCSNACADDIENIIKTHTSGDLAAVVVEPIMGEGGIIVPPQDWLARVQEITHDYGGLLIVDEVQTGYGRTGEMWASDHFDVVPDIMPQAKGIANGLPLGAFTAREEVANAFESGDHLSTFGGNPVACAAALETIEQLEDGLIQNTRRQGSWLNERLTELEAEYDVVGETRGLGLMHGVELVDTTDTGPRDVAAAPDPELAKQIGQTLRDQGIIMGVGGFYKNVIRFQPPLTIKRDQLQRAVEGLETAIQEMTA